MRVWLDVYDPTYTTKLGDGPIRVRSASVKRALDESGSGSADLVGIDPRVVTLLSPRRVCEIWFHEDGFTKRKMGAFVIEGDSHNISSGNNTRGVSGRSPMVALLNKIVLPGLSYTDTVQNVVDDLVAMAGWTASVDVSIASDTISVQFGGGENILRALQVIAEIKGVHLRESKSVSEQIDLSPFGDDAGVSIEYIDGDAGEISRRIDDVLVIEQLSVEQESSEIFNYALGFAGGSGDAAIDLGLSTRSFIDSVVANGRTHYIIKDNASIATYGQIERRVDAKRIIPVDTTDAALEAAANAAADAIKAKLDRYTEPQEVLSVTVRNVRATISPGDKIHVRFYGMTYKNNVPYKWREIDADYWVMRVSETVRADGISLSLTISNIDRYQASAAGVIVGMVDAIQAQEVDVQPFPSSYPWGPFQQPIDTVTDVDFFFPIFDNVLRLNSVQAYIIRDVWTAVASSTAAGGGTTESSAGGGDHTHVMFGNGFASADIPLNRLYNAANSVSVGLYVNATGGPPSTLTTFGASGTHTHDITIPNHTHDTEFAEVQKDNLKASDLDITVNGTAIATGVFPDDGGAEYVTADIVKLDITNAVKNKAGGFRTWHTMNISAGADRGDIAVVFLIDVDISKVRTS